MNLTQQKTDIKFSSISAFIRFLSSYEFVVQPPSTTNSKPVTYFDSSDAKYKYALAISSASPAYGYFLNEQTDFNDDCFITYRAYGVWGLIVNWIKDDFQTPSHDMANQLIKIINYHPLRKYETRKYG